MNPANRETQPAPRTPDGSGLGSERHEQPAGGMPRSGEDPNLGDLLQELRILQQGSLVLTAFLIVLPFNAGFTRLPAAETGVYLATFLCALGSLILLSAPAAHHRLTRPLHDRRAFKTIATRLALMGLALFSVSLTLATYLIVSAVVRNDLAAILLAVVVGVFILVLWWLYPWVAPWNAAS